MLSRLKNYAFVHFGYPAKNREVISKAYLRKLLPKNPVMIDCGAHDGSDTVELAKVIRGKVYAFEPVPAVFKRLQNNTKHDPLISCFQLALADKDGTAVFHVSEGSSDASSSILPPKSHLEDHPDVLFNTELEVKTMTLDSWAKENNVDHIDLLWLDMQGFEMQALKASPNILKTVKAIHTEVSVKETYDGVVLYPEFKKWLEAQGFCAKVEAIPEEWDMGNVLFVRNN